MGSKYSVIHFVPDSRSGERINVGVIVTSDGKTYARFLKDWKRVECFSGKDIHFLNNFKNIVTKVGEPNLIFQEIPESWHLDESEIASISESWRNMIQLSSPIGTTLSPDVLLERVAKIFLKEPAHTTRSLRDKPFAVNLLVEPAQRELIDLCGTSGKELIKRNCRIQGKRFKDDNTFDFAIRDEKSMLTYVAACAISYEIKTVPIIRQQSKNLVHTVSDVREINPSLRIVAMILPPVKSINDEQSDPRNSDSYRKLKDYYDDKISILKSLDVEVLSEGQQDEWMKSTLAKVIPPSLF